MPHAPDWTSHTTDHLWLPYTQMKHAPAPLAVIGTQGSRIHLADGRALIDGVASWWTACHGYNHPALIAAIRAQAEIMPHVMLGGLVHEGAVTLAARLAHLTGMSRVFFVDSGSVAVEVALKMALQYWRNHGQPQRQRFVAFRHGYHGDTFGAMGVSDPEQNYHRAFGALTRAQNIIDLPHSAEALRDFDHYLHAMGQSLAGVIIEPLVQGAGGMRFHAPELLEALHRIVKSHGLLFIADEIATGFGRTGSLFACQQAGIVPDILTLGKALTGGTLTLAATLASAEMFDAFWSDDPEAALMHGPTYMGNALACAAALASLDLFATEPRLEQVAAIETHLTEALAACWDLPDVVDVRVKGAIGVVQLRPEAIDRTALRASFAERGCYIRPLEDVVYLTPALTIGAEELETLCRVLHDGLAARGPSYFCHDSPLE